MATQEHETHIVERDGSSGIVAGIAVVALLVLAFFLFFNWNGGTVAVDVPTVTVDVDDGQ